MLGSVDVVFGAGSLPPQKINRVRIEWPIQLLRVFRLVKHQARAKFPCSCAARPKFPLGQSRAAIPHHLPYSSARSTTSLFCRQRGNGHQRRASITATPQLHSVVVCGTTANCTMAGGLVKYRHLSRNSAARKALLRGLVTQLVQYEHIQTTHAKAKEAQRLAEKLITLAKRNNEPCRRSAQGILYVCGHLLCPPRMSSYNESVDMLATGFFWK